MAAKLKKYSVLLQYPEWIACDGPETFYAHVRGRNPTEAAIAAIKQAVRHNDTHFFEEETGRYCDSAGSPSDFAVELVLPGWHKGRYVELDDVECEVKQWLRKTIRRPK